MKPLDFNPTGMTADEWARQVREWNLIKEIIHLRAYNRSLKQKMRMTDIDIPKITYEDWVKEFEIQRKETDMGRFFKCRW